MGYEIYADGSDVRNSPIGCSYCIFIKDTNKKVLEVVKERKDILYLEYFAILIASRLAIKDSYIFSDAQSVVDDLNFKNKLNRNPILNSIHDEIISLKERKKLKIVWIPRNKNLAGKIIEDRLKKLHTYLWASTGGRVRKRFKYKEKHLKVGK